MIPDEPEPLDFSWFIFIGLKDLNLKPKETMRLTLLQFTKLYQHYKNQFDFELSLTLSRTTYRTAAARAAKFDDMF